MEGIGFIIVVGTVFWLVSNSDKTRRPKSTISSRYTGTSSSSAISKKRSSAVRSEYQPEDRCTCGGRWIKKENSKTGGRFFSCSNYPNCKKTRDQVLRQTLGASYSIYFCSRGHEKAHVGSTTDPSTGRELCNRCLTNGYVTL